MDLDPVLFLCKYCCVLVITSYRIQAVNDSDQENSPAQTGIEIGDW